MRWVLMVVSSALIASHSGCDSAGDGTPSDTDSSEIQKYGLPEDPKATVISLDFRGGYGPPRIADSPTMSILADRTVLIPVNYAGARAFEGRLTESELHDRRER
jgi:hypothetical protein